MECRDAQRAWAEMGTKHERAIETILELQNELNKVSKDLPWMDKELYKLAEENTVQQNEIQSLKVIQQKYDELLDDVSLYGMTAKRPEYYQQMCEQIQRQLTISNNHLQRSETYAKILKEKLEAQQETANEEKDWLRAQLKKNSRSPACWAKFRRTAGHALGSKSAWGVRCACTEPEIAYGLRDQAPRIAELEATVVARDRTITHLQTGHKSGPKDQNSSASNTAKISLSLTEHSSSDSINRSEPTNTTHQQGCGHEQRCRTLEKQVTDDAETLRELRRECQELRDDASNVSNADTAVTDAKAIFEEELAAKDAVIEELREEKTKASEELAKKNTEITTLREEKRSAVEECATDISNLDEELVDAREVAAERKQDLGRQKSRIGELEAAQSGLEDTIKAKDLYIEELENANLELAEQPAPESAETLQLLQTANSNLDQLRLQHAECEGRSEVQTARISELEAAGRELEATTKLKDDTIAGLEEQISRAPSADFIERQNQSHNDAIEKKNEQYQALYDAYKQAVDQQRLAEAKYNENVQALNVAQQSYNTTRLELQNLWANYTHLRNIHTNCDGRMNELASQLRQGANAHTDLQVRYNTQATELDTANQNARELQGEVAKLQQANAHLQQTSSSSESEVEKHRREGEDRARPVWQANVDREMSAVGLRLEASQGEVFKLQHQLQQAKNQATPLREMQLQAREDAVKLREDALRPADTDAMDHDQVRRPGSQSTANPEVKTLEDRLAAATKEAGDARLRNRGIQSQLTKEKKERKEEKERHEREMRKEQEDAKTRSEIQKIRLEKENPLKGTVSALQNEVAKLKKELKERS